MRKAAFIYSITIFSTISANAQLTISVPSATICAGSCAALTPTVSGGNPPYTYSWNPGSQTTQTIIACPTANTAYTVTVIDNNSNTATANANIRVNPLPGYVPNTSVTCLGDAVTLTGSALPIAGDPILSWNWSMPGGVPSSDTNQNTCTLYPTPGARTVSLIITTQKGCTDTIVQQIIIYNLPIANFTSSIGSNGATFSDSSQALDGIIVSWQWSFPGASPSSSTAKNPPFISYANGNYSANLTVTTNYGCKDTVQESIVIGSIREYPENNRITAYPNPFSISTTLRSNKNFKEATLTVYNSWGQQVKNMTNISGQTIFFSRDSLPSGIYFISLSEEGKTLATNKLIITDD